MDKPPPRDYREPDPIPDPSMPDLLRARLEFRLEGDPRDGGFVRAQDFVEFLEGVVGALRSLERSAAEKGAGGIVYRIVELETGSAVVALEAEAIPGRADPTALVARFVSGAEALRDGTIQRAELPRETKRAFERLARPLQRNLRSAVIQADTKEVALGTTASTWELRGEPELAAVSLVSGFVDAINVHRDPVFYLYPVVGPSRIPCAFDRRDLETVRNALRRFVTVHGLLEYPESSAFPSRVVVERLEIHPPVAELPLVRDLIGSVPDLTGGVDSVEFIRRQRDVQA